MEVQYSEMENGIRLIKLVGQMDLFGTNLIEAAFMHHCSGENLRVIVDLAKVSYLSSIGIPLLVAGYKAVTTHGGKLVLLNPSRSVAEILDLTGMTHIMKIFYDPHKAIKELTE